MRYYFAELFNGLVTEQVTFKRNQEAVTYFQKLYGFNLLAVKRVGEGNSLVFSA